MTFWRDRNVLVTGATGLLGGWLVEALLQRRANVTCLVRDWVPRSRAVESGLLARTNSVRGSLEDYELVLRTLNEYEIDSVFHLGAQTIVGTAARSPRSTFEGNVRGTWNVLDACRECPKLVERVVVASSDKAYGEHARLPYREDTPLQGRFPYDASKSCTDLIALSYYHTYGTPVSITRCGNLFGGGDLNFNRLIPGTIRSAILDQSPIIRSDGRFVRDYFYVKDAVDAYLLLAEQMPGEAFVGEAFNFGTETPVTVLDLVESVLRLMGKESLEPTILNEASNEILRQYLDCSKARRLLDWSPGHTQDDALRETISWYRTWVVGSA
ncbi:MAG TPA: GDP-mannose 4,6-dehydratase [Candidatus Polarisedimenticolia bacterium]|nr:GDP-mannose 4,6-dehydratase [Candidatus Polarisedimenticolia bacterium]